MLLTLPHSAGTHQHSAHAALASELSTVSLHRTRERVLHLMVYAAELAQLGCALALASYTLFGGESGGNARFILGAPAVPRPKLQRQHREYSEDTEFPAPLVASCACNYAIVIIREAIYQEGCYYASRRH